MGGNGLQGRVRKEAVERFRTVREPSVVDGLRGAGDFGRCAAHFLRIGCERHRPDTALDQYVAPRLSRISTGHLPRRTAAGTPAATGLAPGMRLRPAFPGVSVVLARLRFEFLLRLDAQLAETLEGSLHSP